MSTAVRLNDAMPTASALIMLIWLLRSRVVYFTDTLRELLLTYLLFLMQLAVRNDQRAVFIGRLGGTEPLMNFKNS